MVRFHERTLLPQTTGSTAMICSLFAVAACSGDSEQQTKQAAQKAEELALMRDVSKAAPEIDVR
jgi:hypothetical protein